MTRPTHLSNSPKPRKTMRQHHERVGCVCAQCFARTQRRALDDVYVPPWERSEWDPQT